MRRAEVRTELDHAAEVAASIRPDNTEQMDTRLEDGAIVTTIERETTGGLRSTVDDYVVNLDVAVRTMQHANRHTTQP
jgi:tRNA threonylcarbamoyladenosine modification (KEOPS) complex  Pcc1 subunit